MTVERNCDGCGAALKPTWPWPERMRRHNDWPNYADALVVDVAGGYGMFYDTERHRRVICGDCARKLVEAAPYLGIVEGDM